MNYNVELSTENHDAEWFEHYDTEGGLQIICEAGENAGGFIVSAGWGNFTVCPVCGVEIDLTTEEI